MQNMQNCRKYTEYDLHTDLTGEELVDTRSIPGVELWVNWVEHRTNNFGPHVVKPPAIDWLRGPKIVPAQAAVSSVAQRHLAQSWQKTRHLGSCLPASRSIAFFPEELG